MHAARQIGGPDGARLAAAAGDAFTGGFAEGVILAACAALAAALTSLALREPTLSPEKNGSP
jgi:hypothetical protein